MKSLSKNLRDEYVYRICINIYRRANGIYLFKKVPICSLWTVCPCLRMKNISISYLRIADVFATVAEDAGYPAHVMNEETAITPDNDFKIQGRGCWIMHQDAFQVRK